MPTELFGRLELARRLHVRGGRPEYRFFFRDHTPILPALLDGQYRLARWGNGQGQSASLPRTKWTKRSEVEAGYWRESRARKVEIPATFALAGRGVWYQVVRGIEALLVTDEAGDDVVYLICEPASHYYRIMTGDDWMPLLLDQFI